MAGSCKKKKTFSPSPAWAVWMMLLMLAQSMASWNKPRHEAAFGVYTTGDLIAVDSLEISCGNEKMPAVVDDVPFPIQPVPYSVIKHGNWKCPSKSRSNGKSSRSNGLSFAMFDCQKVGVMFSPGDAWSLYPNHSARVWPWQKMAIRLQKYCRQRVPYSTRSMKELFPGYARITAKSMSWSQDQDLPRNPNGPLDESLIFMPTTKMKYPQNETLA